MLADFLGKLSLLLDFHLKHYPGKNFSILFNTILSFFSKELFCDFSMRFFSFPIEKSRTKISHRFRSGFFCVFFFEKLPRRKLFRLFSTSVFFFFLLLKNGRKNNFATIYRNFLFSFGKLSRTKLIYRFSVRIFHF